MYLISTGPTTTRSDQGHDEVEPRDDIMVNVSRKPYPLLPNSLKYVDLAKGPFFEAMGKMAAIICREMV